MQPILAHDVFISYSSYDKVVADTVCANLESRGIRCWIAPRDVLPGVPYAEALINGLNQSRLMVLVFSNNSNTSPQVEREVERAVNKGIPIIPLRIENVVLSKSMEYFVSSSHWLDALTLPLESHLQRLADTIQVLLAGGNESSARMVLPPSSPTVLRAKLRNKATPLLIIVGSVIGALAIIGVIFLVGGFGRHPQGRGTLRRLYLLRHRHLRLLPMQFLLRRRVKRLIHLYPHLYPKVSYMRMILLIHPPAGENSPMKAWTPIMKLGIQSGREEVELGRLGSKPECRAICGYLT